MDTKRLTIGVIGPSGLGGSHSCVELLNRDHKVVGLSRHPEKLGSHPNYSPRSIDIDKDSIAELSQAFEGLDVLINAYGPHSSGLDKMLYMPFLEATRKIILAGKKAKVGYFVMIGGCGSLELPGPTAQTAVESPDFWLAFTRAMGDSEAYTLYLEQHIGASNAAGFRVYRNARLALQAGRDTEDTRRVREEHERSVLNDNPVLSFITACRTSLMFFDGNTSFRWTFISPPALYRSGRRTGTYNVLFDKVPLEGDNTGSSVLEGRLRGVTASDLAIAIADEAETRRLEGKHWTVWAELCEEVPASPFAKISSLGKL